MARKTQKTTSTNPGFDAGELVEKVSKLKNAPTAGDRMRAKKTEKDEYLRANMTDDIKKAMKDMHDKGWGYKKVAETANECLKIPSGFKLDAVRVKKLIAG